MTLKLYSARPSNSGRDLANGLGIRRIKREGSRYRPKRNDVLINWGNTELPERLSEMDVVNGTGEVYNAVNKRCFLQMMTDGRIPTLEHTTEKTIALQWGLDGSDIVVRKLLRSSGANGLEIVNASPELTLEDIPNAPLYTKYFKKRHEYRVHVVGEVVVDVQRKARVLDVPDENVNWKVRNLENGFIYARDGIHSNLKEVVGNLCLEAHEVTGLDFGAYDVLYNSNSDTYVVIEVNTAPGLTGTTLEKYIEAFSTYL